MRAVLFDFDGVIGNTMEDNFLAWQKALGDINVPIDREAYFLMEGMKLADVARIFCKKVGVECDEAVIVRKKDEYYLKNASFSFYPGAEQLLAGLKARKMPFALVTAARRERLEASLPKDFLNNFGALVTSENSVRGKPFADPYLAAAELLHVPIAECVVVENAPLGIRAAKAAGAYCIAISSTLSEDKLREADEVVADIRDIAKTDSIKNFHDNK